MGVNLNFAQIFPFAFHAPKSGLLVNFGVFKRHLLISCNDSSRKRLGVPNTFEIWCFLIGFRAHIARTTTHPPPLGCFDPNQNNGNRAFHSINHAFVFCCFCVVFAPFRAAFYNNYSLFCWCFSSVCWCLRFSCALSRPR